MLKSFEGIYRNGRVDLLERPDNSDGSRVIVTFVPTEASQSPILGREELAELRWQLASFEDDWNAPGMEKYDAL